MEAGALNGPGARGGATEGTSTWSLRSALPIAAPLAVGGFAIILRFDATASPETYLMLAAALCAALASVPRSWVRLSAQAAVLAIVANALLSAERSSSDVVFVVALLVTTAVLAGIFVRRMRSARLAALQAGEQATSRAELLDAVRDLPGSTAEEATVVVCRAIRSLGFHGAAVAVLENGSLVTTEADGRAPPALASDDGPGWTAIREERVVVRSEIAAEQGDREAARHPSRYATGGSQPPRVSVVAPVRVDGDPLGVVAGTWCHPYAPSEADIAVVEVLASHLGGVLAAEARIARQAELLTRRAMLDRMRGELLGAVSDEVRDPLTILRGAGQILASHADRISDEQRVAFLERMCAQATDLGVVIDVLLDFSRSQSQRHDPIVAPISLLDLLHPLRRGSSPEPAMVPDHLALSDVTVLVDAALVRSGMELLIDLRSDGFASSAVQIVDADGHAELRLALPPDTPMSDLVRSLVSQLLQAGGARLDIQDHIVVRLDHAPVATGPYAGHAKDPGGGAA